MPESAGTRGGRAKGASSVGWKGCEIGRTTEEKELEKAVRWGQIGLFLNIKCH